MSDYDPIKCPMPGCGADLYMVLRFSTPIQVGSTVEDLYDPRAAASQDWEVTCSGGHVVVLPADTAQDDYVFGADPDHQDAARLAETTGWKP